MEKLKINKPIIRNREKLNNFEIVFGAKFIILFRHHGAREYVYIYEICSAIACKVGAHTLQQLGVINSLDVQDAVSGINMALVFVNIQHW